MPREAARLATVVQEFARTVGTAVIERELRELVKRSTSPRAALPRWVTERASAATVAAG